MPKQLVQVLRNIVLWNQYHQRAHRRLEDMSENTFNHQHDTDEVYHYRPVSTLQILEVW